MIVDGEKRRRRENESGIGGREKVKVKRWWNEVMKKSMGEGEG